MIPTKGLHRIPGLEIDPAGRELEGMGYRVFVLPQGLNDRRSFFDAVRALLPLDPPLASDNWDALSDSLWSGLHALEEERIAILWPDSAQSQAGMAQEDYDIATAIFSDVSDELTDPEATLGRVKRLVVVLT